MEDLKKESGLNIYLKDDFRLDLDIKLLGGEFSSRTIRDMEKVIKDKIEINDNPLYFMYRDVRQRTDDQRIREGMLRYDLTVVLPRTIGSEYNKTFGHYHPIVEGLDITYPEVYEVIYGKAHFLLQKRGKKDDQIEKAILVEVNAGEKAIIPPNYGHVTINTGDKPIVMSNWVDADFSSDYEQYERLGGGCYYFVKGDKGKNLQIIKNDKYKKVPELIKAKPKEILEFGIRFEEPIYKSAIHNITAFEYLKNPKKYIQKLQLEAVFNLN